MEIPFLSIHRVSRAIHIFETSRRCTTILWRTRYSPGQDTRLEPRTAQRGTATRGTYGSLPPQWPTHSNKMLFFPSLLYTTSEPLFLGRRQQHPSITSAQESKKIIITSKNALRTPQVILTIDSWVPHIHILRVSKAVYYSLASHSKMLLSLLLPNLWHTNALSSTVSCVLSLKIHNLCSDTIPVLMVWKRKKKEDRRERRKGKKEKEGNNLPVQGKWTIILH